MPSTACPAWLKEEFRRSNFRLNYPDPSVFYCSPWTTTSPARARWGSVAHVTLSLVLASYAIFAFIHGQATREGQSWLLYVTWWSFLVITVLLVLKAVIAVVFRKEVRKSMLVSGDKDAETTTTSLESSSKESRAPTPIPTDLEAPPLQTQMTTLAEKLSEIPEASISQESDHRTLTSKSSQKLSTVQFSSIFLLGQRPKSKNQNMNRITFHQESTYPPSSTDSSEPHVTPTKWYFRLVWALSALAGASVCLVTLIYWSMLYCKGDNPTCTIDLGDFNVHGANIILVAADFAVSAVPVRLLHFYWVVGFGVAWTIMSMIYAQFEEEPIYLITDWNKAPGKTVGYCCGLTLVVLMIHGLMFGLFKVKRMCYRRFWERSDAVWKRESAEVVGDRGRGCLCDMTD